jgi:beta-N-acetylhexosaminidase
MILIGYKGHDFRSNDPVVDEIKSGRVGGIILFESNISEIEATERLKKLTSGLQSNATIPLFMSIDQEGGVVNRLKPKYGFPKSVTAEYLGKLDDMDSTRYYAESMAHTLSTLGFNINFAPVLDLNINQHNPIIAAHGRSFSKDPVIATRHAEIIIGELRSEGIIAVGKHFPGHGSSLGDTHKGIVDVTDTWQKNELIPYKTLIQEEQLEAVMVAHIVNANLDPKMLPGSLSGLVIDGLLRDSLNFNGVAFSDDMRMKAISNYFTVKKAIELGINAGLDVLTYSINTSSKDRRIDMIHTLIKELVEEGRVDEERINLSYQRIMKLKKAYLYDSN